MPEPPLLDDASRLCLRALHDLNTCRAIGFTAGPIPFTAFVVWAEAFDVDGEIALVVWNVISQRDADAALAAIDQKRMDNMRGGQ